MHKVKYLDHYLKYFIALVAVQKYRWRIKMEYSIAQIKTEFNKRWFNKNGKKILLQVVMCLVWIGIIYFTKIKLEGWKQVIWVAPLILVGANAIVSYNKAQKKFIAKVRLNPELLQ
jgi:amino acid transporter